MHFTIRPPACHTSQPPPDQHQPSAQHHRPALPRTPHRWHQHPRRQPQKDSRGRDAQRHGQREENAPRGRTDGTARPDNHQNRQRRTAATPGLLPSPDGHNAQRNSPAPTPAEADRGERERGEGERGEGSEGKTAVKAPPFDHLPDWRHQPSPGHPMTPRGHQTAPDGQTAEGEHPAPVLLLWSMQNQP